MNNNTLIAPTLKAKLAQKLAYAISILTIIAAAVLIILAVIDFSRESEQQTTLQEQTKKTNQLIQQVKQESEANERISKEAANYAYCNSILLSAYTQTLQPIEIKDIDKCILSSFSKGTIVSPNKEVQQNSAMPDSSLNSSQAQK